MKSSWLIYGQTNTINPLNPYRTGESIINNAVFREPVSENANVPFDHSYLESPRFNPNANVMPPGDLYEIQTKIYTANLGADDYPGCLFDIHMATGDNLSANPDNTDGYILESTSNSPYSDRREETVFSTFNQAVKWYTAAKVGQGSDPDNLMQTSNYFVMPNLPTEYQGFHIQVGPANSDNNFALRDIPVDLQNQPLVCNTYMDKFANPILRRANPVPNNFGLGLPWLMMLDLYSWVSPDIGYCEYDVGSSNSSYHFWWNDNDGILMGNSWANEPTLASDRVELQEVRLLRYSRNPYMLKSVKKYVFDNGGELPEDYCDLEEDWNEVSNLQFRYESMITDNFVRVADQFDNSVTVTAKNKRCYFLLSQITQLPVGSSDDEADPVYQPVAGDEDAGSDWVFPVYPTSHFTYKTFSSDINSLSGATIDPLPGGAGTGDWENILYPNANYAILESITSPLGKTTTIEYGAELPFPQFLSRQRFIHPIGLGGFLQQSSNTYQQVHPYAIRTYMIVDKIKVRDRNGEKQWNYTFGEPGGINDGVPLSEKFRFDHDYSSRQHGYGLTTVSGPSSGGAGGPSVTYRHHTSERFWGKVFQVQNFDANGFLLGETNTEFDQIVAFEPAVHRVRRGNASHNQYDYHEYRTLPISDNRPMMSDYPDLDAYNDAFQGWRNGMIEEDWPAYLDWLADAPVYPSLLCGAHVDPSSCTDCGSTGDPFPAGCGCENYSMLTDAGIALCGEYLTNYDIWLNDQPEEITHFAFRAAHPDLFRSGGFYDVPYFYETRYADFIDDHNPDYLYSFFIKKTRETKKVYDYLCKSGSTPASMTSITDYEYFDADYKGTSTCTGYSEFGVDERGLLWEPSFQLYKTTTNAPALGTRKTEEFFYLYDLINSSDYQDASDFQPTENWLMLRQLWERDGIRNLPYQSRVTIKGAEDEEVTRSTYYLYDNNWEPVMPAAIFPTIENPYEGGSSCPEVENPYVDQSDNSDLDQSVYTQVIYSSDNLPCYNFQHPQHIPADFCPNEDYPGYWCPCIAEDAGQPFDGDRSDDYVFGDNPEPHVVNRLADKIYLSEVRTQVESGDDELLSFDNGNNYSPLIPYKSIRLNKIHQRNLWGQIVQEEDERGLRTYYDYGTTEGVQFPDVINGIPTITRIYFKNTTGLPKKVIVGYDPDPNTVSGEEVPDPLTTTYEYNIDRTINKVTDPNGMELRYEYDGFLRMTAAYRNDDLIEDIQYNNWENDFAKSFRERSHRNFVKTITHLNEEDSWGSQNFLDPLGRNVSHVKFSNTSSVVVEDNIYDLHNRSLYKLKPYAGGLPSVNEEDFPGFEAKDHAEFLFDTAPRARPLKASKYGEAINGSHTVNLSYCIVNLSDLSTALSDAGQLESPLGTYFFKVETTDEDGKIVEEYTNEIGQKVATITNNGTVATVFKYDSFGNVKKVFNPNNQETEYRYNYLGQLYEKVTVDGGTTQYAYDHSGNLLTEVHPNGQIRHFDYDRFGRMIRQVATQVAYYSDQGLPWLNALDGNDDPDGPDYAYFYNLINSATAVAEKIWLYSAYDNGQYIGDYDDNALLYLNNSLSYALGRLVQAISFDHKEGDVIEHRFYSYTKEGFLKWEMSQLKQPQNLLTRIDYRDYNRQGSFAKQQVDLSGDGTLDFQYEYDYDSYGRIENVYASYDDPDSEAERFKVVDYTYDDVLEVVSSKRYYDSADPATGENTVTLTCR
ncbi:MAG: hypothetical protein AAFP19_18850, partial [Bacteroidota bacterium]